VNSTSVGSEGNGISSLLVSTSDSADGSNTTDEYWSMDGLRSAEENDPDISGILQLMKQSEEKPSWDAVALHSHDARVLWNMWPRLRVWNGILQRKFESSDGLTVNWQVVLPAKLWEEFLAVIHGGMTGGHLARRRTTASVQARAYWPTWSSDLDRVCTMCTISQGKSAKESRNAYAASR